MSHLATTPRRLAAAFAAMGLAAALLTAPPPTHSAAAEPATALPELPTMYASANQPRLADGINPPTNSWISGAVFNKDGLFAPTWVGGGLAFRAQPTKFGVALPELWTWGDKAIIASWVRNGDAVGTENQAISLSPAGASDYRLTRLDDISADLTWYAGGTALGTLTAVEGWPYVQYRAASAQQVASDRPLTSAGSGHWTWQAPTGQTMHLVSRSASLSGSSLSLPAGGMVHVFAEPNGATASDIAALVAGSVRVRGTSVSHGVQAGRASTTFTLDTENSAETVFTQMAHQNYGLSTLTGRWENPNGWARGVRGTRFTYSVPAYTSQRDVDLSGLSASQRTELASLVRADVATATAFTAEDTYFVGKELFRAVNLYRLAVQLGLDSEATTLKSALTGQLDLWMDPQRCRTTRSKCFSYDATLKTVVGHQDSFGSGDNANDHHFHYGYFLYAAGILALDDPSLVTRYATVADALVADIASPTDTGTSIKRRAFDDWRGHSWANGTGGGFDGNDQESTSEAVNAWAGLDFWARATGNGSMSAQATWMLSNEAATAAAYWWQPYRTGDFNKTIVSMMFAGKTDYGTWWSPDASDILGIQVIPMGPTQFAYLSALGSSIITPAFDAVLDYNPQVSGRSHLIDWNIMLLSLADRSRAQRLYAQLSDADIDNGNTRAYLYAVIASGAATDSAVRPGPSDTTPPAPTPTATATPTVAPTTAPTPTPTVTPTTAPVADPYAGFTVSTGQMADGGSVTVRLDFGNGGYTDATLTLASGATGGISGLVELRAGDASGRVLGSLSVANTGGWDVWRTIPFNVEDGLTGVQDITVTFASGQPAPFATLRGGQFRGHEGAAPEPTATPTPTAGPRAAVTTIPVTAATASHGVRFSGEATVPLASGTWLAFDLDFGTQTSRDVVARVASGAAGGVSGLVQVRVGAPDANPVGALALANTGGWDAWRDVPFNAGGLSGVQRVYVTFDSAQPAPYVALRSLAFRA